LLIGILLSRTPLAAVIVIVLFLSHVLWQDALQRIEPIKDMFSSLFFAAIG
jgi:Kef-type K+ transport system membrane component KefB